MPSSMTCLPPTEQTSFLQYSLQQCKYICGSIERFQVEQSIKVSATPDDAKEIDGNDKAGVRCN